VADPSFRDLSLAGVAIGTLGQREAQRLGGSAVYSSQRPTRAGEDADAGISWNLPDSHLSSSAQPVPGGGRRNDPVPAAGHPGPGTRGAGERSVRQGASTRTVVIAWALWLGTMALGAAGLVVTLLVTRPLTAAVLAEGAAFAVAFPLGYATVGLVLGLRRPGNPIGWLFAASGLIWSLTIPGDPWVDQLILDHRPLPLAARLAAVVGEFNWAPAIAYGITLPALLVPNGRLRSGRWRPVVAVAAVAPVLGLIAGGLAPGQLEETVRPIPSPFGLAGTPAAVASAVALACLVLWLASMLAALVSLVLRFRASRGTERQQLRWVVAGAAGAVAGLLAGMAGAVATYVAVLCVPVGVAVAVLRYRLWDLDRLVSRTVTYALVTALLVIPYLLILPATSRLAAGSGSLAVAAATLAVAAAFQPLRRRVQGLVDRRFNRRRYDAARTLEGFAARLRDQLDLDALEAELLTVADQTMQPTRASLWLRARPADAAKLYQART
jgi:hypothetical protein